MIIYVWNIQSITYAVGGYTGYDCGKKKIVPDAADRQHFDAIERPRYGRTEYAGETGADAACHDPPPQFGVQPQNPAQARRQCRDDMRAWAFYAGQAAGGERNYRRYRFYE